jgi:hypothetical protein
VILNLEHFVKVLLTKCALNGHLVVLEINRKIQLAMSVEISCGDQQSQRYSTTIFLNRKKSSAFGSAIGDQQSQRYLLYNF